jgi:alanyl-tRNA synthetase
MGGANMEDRLYNNEKKENMNHENLKDRLYYQEAYITHFVTQLTSQCLDDNGRPYAILDETAFYPTGGGQPSDQGTINGTRVIEVEEVNGEIRHYLDHLLPDGTTTINGVIDWDRRFDHMQQHSGQHILSAAFAELFDWKTLSFHLGQESVTIDLETEQVSEDDIEKAQAFANRVVLSNQKIETKWVEKEDLPQYPLRKAPKVNENIRLVIIDQVDYNACGGTHPNQTAEVGPIQILGTEKAKNKVRVSFVCGLRAIKALNDKHKIIKKLTQKLNKPEPEILETIDTFFEELQVTKGQLNEAKKELLDYEATSLLKTAQSTDEGELLVTQYFIERELSELQHLSYALTDQGPTAIVLLTVKNGDKLQFVAATGRGVSRNMNDLCREILPLINGKGGGKPDRVQGGGEVTMTASALLEHMKKLFRKEPIV